MRCPHVQTSEPNGLPAGTPPSGSMRRILPFSDAAVLGVRGVARVADARVELAVGPERDPPAVVDAGLLQPVSTVRTLPPSLKRTIRLSVFDVKYA